MSLRLDARSGKRFFVGLRAFAGDIGGNVAMIFAFALLPILLAVGAAVDYGHGNAVRVRIQAALDATGLMLAHGVGTLPADELLIQADEIFAANFLSEAGVTISPLHLEVQNETIILSAAAQVDTAIMGLAGYDVMDVNATTEIVRGEDSYEIVLVLDNTTSMRGSKIRALQDAAEDLVDSLFADQSQHPLLDMALVPFASTVNVGADNRNEAWIDGQGLNADIHFEQLDDQDETRFDIYDNISNVSWPGCVEAREYPYDVRDTAPASGNPSTLFQPYFHPDEPGDGGDSDRYYTNSYLDDQTSGSQETRQKYSAKYSQTRRRGGGRRGGRRGGGGGGSTQVTAEQDGSSQYGLGPAYMCTANPILPLTNVKRRIIDAIDDMKASGYTNITEGLMWGWRVISPAAPFTEGVAYDTDDHHKIIILLTDGENRLNGASNHNRSEYSAYGYTATGRLGTTSSSSQTIENKMNQRTAEACENVKDAGIELFTITFQVGDSTTESLMRNCATKPDMYYDSPNTATLKTVFKSIATRISELRISK